jgi:hypothetical protein
MISFVTQAVLTGMSETAARNSKPRTTIDGPESQTIRKTGGTFFSARSRSFQALRNGCCWSAVTLV